MSMSHPLGFLKSDDPFSKLKGTVFEDMATRLRMIKAKPGVEIYRAGDASPVAYYVYRGRVRLTLPDADGNDIELGEVKKGGVCGHSSMLTGTVRVATATTIESSELIEIGRDDFLILVERWRLNDIEHGT
jgi:CRP-like cAMP-binding protein